MLKKTIFINREQDTVQWALINNLPFLAWLKDSEGRFLAVNEMFAKSCGHSINEIIGKTDLDIWSKELAELYISDDREVMTKKTKKHVEEQIDDQGIIKWFETFKTPVLDSVGKILGTAGFARDISERKNAEEELKNAYALISGLLDSIPDIIFFKNKEGIYLGCNPEFARLVGKPKDEIIGKTDYDLFQKEAADFFRENDKKMMRINEPCHNEEYVTYPDGKKILLDTLKAPLNYKTGETFGLLGISRDITKTKKSEEQLKISEERLAYALAATGEGVWDWEINSKAVSHNERWCEILGMDNSYLQHTLDIFSERIHPDDRKYVFERIQEGVKTGEYHSIHRLIRKDNNKIIWVEDRGKVIFRDDKGNPIRMVGSVADITEQKLASDELRKYDEVLRSVADASKDLLSVEKSLDSVGNVLRKLGQTVSADRVYIFEKKYADDGKLLISQRFEWTDSEISIKIENPELQNLPFEKLFPGSWYNLMKKGKHVSGLIKNFSENERSILESQNIKSILAVPIILQNNLWGFIGFDNYKNERNWSNLEIEALQIAAGILGSAILRYRVLSDLKTARDAAEQANKAKSEFFANISHEIRTPMNAIVSMSNFLEKTGITPAQQEFIEVLKNASENLLFLIEQILDISKLEKLSVKLENKPFKIKNLIFNIYQLTEIKLKEKNIDFSYKIDDNIPEILTGDMFRLNQILLNLISNASKFTEKGYIKINIVLLNKTENTCNLLFSIADTGIGIDNKYKTLIFEKFSQGDTSITRKYGGSGLGLFISREIVGLMGGKMWIEDNKPHGSIFNFNVEFKIPSSEEIIFISSDETEEQIILKKDKKYKILIAEDDKTNQFIIKKLFNPYNNFILVLANNGIEAVEEFTRNKFDLILMDLHMPEMDGISAIKEIRKKERDNKLEKTNILIFTATTIDKLNKDTKNLDISGYILKPVDPKKFYAKINDILDGNFSTNETKLTDLKTDTKSTFIEIGGGVIKVDNALKKLNDNLELYLELIEIYYESYGIKIDEIKNMFEKEYVEEMLFISHKIISAAANIGALKLSEISNEIQSIIKNNKKVSEEKKYQFIKEFSSVNDIIKQIIDMKKSFF
ncbi:PAS domain S-box protein [Candidatus Dependentiae bacterium]|nr:PAS domain S-box protein [Candidatus Dependentiae bacterium]